MLVIVFIIFVICVLFLQTMIEDLQMQNTNSSSIISNATLGALISDAIWENWISGPPESKAWGDNFTANSSISQSKSKEKNVLTFNNASSFASSTNTTVIPTVQSDDSSVKTPVTKEIFLKTLFELPNKKIEPDWSVVLGSFDHYDDQNWKEFLIKTEVPLLVRMFLQDSSESVKIAHKLLKNNRQNTKLNTKDSKIPKKYNLEPKFEVTIETSSWLLSHVSKFKLRETYEETDLDGTYSKNTFFFSSPRLLIQAKIKDKWRAAIIRHFDEFGLNMTFVDRDRMVYARRFFKRL